MSNSTATGSLPSTAPRLVLREANPAGTQVRLGAHGPVIGGDEVILMGGPCSVESVEQTSLIAESVAASGARLLRGGAFKPRTSPYAFQGMREEGLRILRDAADAHGLGVVTEVMAPEQVGLVAEYADVLQIGSRSCQNFPLLEAAGRSRRPVLLKRGMMSTVDELLHAAEYILAAGNPDVILCERGIRTFETQTRNTFDVMAVPLLKSLTHLPVIADPSHGTGRADLVIPGARAAVAAGADGLLVEVHHDPAVALSDGDQALVPDQFRALARECRTIARAVGRDL